MLSTNSLRMHTLYSEGSVVNMVIISLACTAAGSCLWWPGLSISYFKATKGSIYYI